MEKVNRILNLKYNRYGRKSGPRFTIIDTGTMFISGCTKNEEFGYPIYNEYAFYYYPSKEICSHCRRPQEVFTCNIGDGTVHEIEKEYKDS
jgi:hypothetical protein